MGPVRMESPIPTRASDPEKMALLRTAASEAAQLKAKGGCPGLPSGLCSSCPVDPGKARPLSGPQLPCL